MALVALVASDALAAAACKKPSGHGENPPAPSAEPPAAASAVQEPVAPGVVPVSRFDAAAVPSDPDDDDAYGAAPKSAKSIGHTSVVFKLELTNGKRAAFKPVSKRGASRYRGEIAARNLGVALGLPNVPRAFFRVYPANELRTALGEKTPGRALFDEEAVVEDGKVRGALVPWIDPLDFLPMEEEPWWSRWRFWLRSGAPIVTDLHLQLGPDGWIGVEAGSVARDTSNLVVFDWLTANFDRWSGGNVGWDRLRKRLLYLDNDGAFLERPPREALEKTRHLLTGIDRFSRLLVTKIRAMTEESLARVLGEEAPGTPFVGAKAVEGIVQRRKELLSIIDEKIAKNGEKETLYFP